MHDARQSQPPDFSGVVPGPNGTMTEDVFNQLLALSNAQGHLRLMVNIVQALGLLPLHYAN